MPKTTITIERAILKRIDRLKTNPRESYSEVLLRLLRRPITKKSDKRKIESLVETIDILSDPDAMRAIEQGLKDVKARRLTSINAV